ncbi:MAG: hypothetical protein HYV09_40425 [Deltaproteobacteria bacterium]|nr:hypothetical protein [Deltaproteobacteria bacterium]
MLRLPILCLVLLVSASASAASYVDAPALGRSTVGFSVLGGTPVGRAEADDRASVLGGGGSELTWGYAWESGFSLAGAFGAARWSSRGPLAQTLRDRDASITEGWAGLSFRHALADADVAPFWGGALVLDAARVSGARSGSASGLAAAARVGLRWRDHPWDLFGAVEVRRAWLSAPYDEADRLAFTRLSVVIGVALEGPVR